MRIQSEQQVIENMRNMGLATDTQADSAQLRTEPRALHLMTSMSYIWPDMKTSSATQDDDRKAERLVAYPQSSHHCSSYIPQD